MMDNPNREQSGSRRIVVLTFDDGFKTYFFVNSEEEARRVIRSIGIAVNEGQEYDFTEEIIAV